MNRSNNNLLSTLDALMNNHKLKKYGYVKENTPKMWILNNNHV